MKAPTGAAASLTARQTPERSTGGIILTDQSREVNHPAWLCWWLCWLSGAPARPLARPPGRTDQAPGHHPALTAVTVTRRATTVSPPPSASSRGSASPLATPRSRVASPLSSPLPASSAATHRPPSSVRPTAWMVPCSPPLEMWNAARETPSSAAGLKVHSGVPSTPDHTLISPLLSATMSSIESLSTSSVSMSSTRTHARTRTHTHTHTHTHIHAFRC